MSMVAVELFRALYLGSLLFGIAAIISLLRSNTGSHSANRYCAMFIMLALLPLSNGYISLTAFSLPFMALQVINKLSWLYGPCAYLLLRVLLKQPVWNHGQALFHGLPFVILTIAIISGRYTESFWLASATFGQIGLYLGLSIVLLIRHGAQLKILFKKFRFTSWYWYGLVTLGAFSLMIFEAISMYFFLQFGGLPVGLWHAFMSGLALYTLAMAGISLLSPELSKFDRHFQEVGSEADSKPAGIDLNELPGKPVYKELTLEVAKLLAKNLKEIMLKERPYLRNELRAIDLANIMNISVHQLSELLNVHLRQSFHDYINEARYKAAKSLLKDEDCSLTVLEVAYESGFNSKNTFYRVFKLNTGETPSAFRKRVISNQKLLNAESS